MTLGPFGFEGIGFGFDSLSHKLDTNWPEIAVAQRMNPLQWTGPTSEEVVIKGVLFPVEHGGMGSLRGIMEAAKTGQPQMLVSGSAQMGVIHGMFAIQSVDEDRNFIDVKGNPRRNAYTITLKRDDGQVPGLSSVNSFLRIFI